MSIHIHLFGRFKQYSSAPTSFFLKSFDTDPVCWFDEPLFTFLVVSNTGMARDEVAQHERQWVGLATTTRTSKFPSASSSI